VRERNHHPTVRRNRSLIALELWLSQLRRRLAVVGKERESSFVVGRTLFSVIGERKAGKGVRT
jgi:hypothetical protein